MRWSIRGLVFLAAALGASAFGAVPAPDFQPASLPAVSRDLVLAATNEGDFRVADLLPYLKAHTPPGKIPEDLDSLIRQPPTNLAALARKRLTQREIARAFRQSNPTLPAELEQAIQKNRAEEVEDRSALQVAAQVQEVTSDTARAYYENNRIEFFEPLRFSMRHLTLLAYVPYVSQTGDTLESVAQRISASPSAIEGILTNAPGKRTRWVPPMERHRRPFKPLEPGERLLVPMSSQDRQEVRRILETDILPQLKEGKDFAWLCQRYSDAEDKGDEIEPLPFSTSPMLPEILQAASSLPVGRISDIIETRHGFEVIEVTRRADQRQKPFEEVADKIKQEIRQKQLTDLGLKEFGQVWANAKVDFEALLNPDAPSSATVVRTRARQWTKGELTARSPDGTLAQATVPDEVKKAIQNDPEIRVQVFLDYAEQEGYFNDPDFAERLDIQSDRVVADWVVDRAQEAAVAQLTDDEIRAWYEAHRDRFAPPASYKVRQIVVNLDPAADLNDPAQRAEAEQKALETLRKSLRGVQTLEDFIAAAQQVSQDARTASNGGLVGQVKAVDKPGKYAEVLARLPAQTPSEPFVYGRMAFVLWVDEIAASPPTPLEQARPAIVQLLESEAKARAERQTVDDALARIGYRSAIAAP